MLLVDNYDSFTYNLAHLLVRGRAPRSTCDRNDALDEEQAEALAPTHLVISPGPGRPADGGISSDADPPLRRAGSRCSACASATSAWSRSRAAGRPAPRG